MENLMTDGERVELTDVDLSDLDRFRDNRAWGQFDTLRREDPLHWNPEPEPNRGFWSVTRYADWALLGAAYLGIRDKLEGYGYDPAKAARLPGDLSAAIDALESDNELKDLLGAPFVASFVAYKRNEIERFSRWVTDWEFREYSYHM